MELLDWQFLLEDLITLIINHLLVKLDIFVNNVDAFEIKANSCEAKSEVKRLPNRNELLIG